jgi:hypothetical protein
MGVIVFCILYSVCVQIKKIKDPELNDSKDFLNLLCFQFLCKINSYLFKYKILKEFIRVGSASKGFMQRF